MGDRDANDRESILLEQNKKAGGGHAGIKKNAMAAGLSADVADRAKKILVKGKGGGTKEMQLAIQELIASDDSIQTRDLFDFLESQAKLFEDTRHSGKVNPLMQSIKDTRAAFVTGSTGPQLRAAGLLEQLGAGQSGLNNGG